MHTKNKSTDDTPIVNKGSAEWRKPLESGRVSDCAVTEIKKTKEKESIRGVKILDHVLPEALGPHFSHLSIEQK